jgi:SnoaL-like domain
MTSAGFSILNTINNYGRYFDLGAPGEAADCFTVDAEMIIGDQMLHGRASIIENLAARRAGARYQDGSKPVHIYTNTTFLSESDEHAAVETHWTFYLIDAEGVARFTALGIYEDILVNDAGTWRIKRRTQRGLGRA